MELSTAWKSVAEVAALLGVSERALRRYVTGAGGRPAMEHRVIAGRMCVTWSTAYEHLARHGEFGALTAPPARPGAALAVSGSGGAVFGLEGAKISSSATTLPPGDELAFLEKILSTGADLSAQDRTSYATVAAAIARIREMRSEAEQRLEPDAVVRMLRSIGEVFVDEMDIQAPSLAKALLEAIRLQFGVDLAQANVAAADILESTIRERLNVVVSAIRQKARDQAEGVQLLEGVR
jgi:hypothetical protein